MKLLTKKLLKAFKKKTDMIANENIPEENDDTTNIVAAFYNPVSGQTWYAEDYNPETRMFSGYITYDRVPTKRDDSGQFHLDTLESFLITDLTPVIVALNNGVIPSKRVTYCIKRHTKLVPFKLKMKDLIEGYRLQ